MTHWYAWIFFALAVVALSGFYYNAMRREGTRMAYSLVMLLVWLGLGLWTGGIIK